MSLTGSDAVAQARAVGAGVQRPDPEALRRGVLAAIAQAAGLPIYPGGQPGTSVGSATAAHFYAATWNVTVGGDFHVGAAGWLADDIVHAPLRVIDGHAFIPDDGPGIGVTLDPLKLEKYTARA